MKQRHHFDVLVEDIERSVGVYSGLFGSEPKGTCCAQEAIRAAARCAC